MSSLDSPGSLLRVERVGVQFDRAFRLLCYVLDRWCSYSGDRTACDGEPNDRLRAIYFDKCAVLVFGVWDELFRATGAKFRGKIETLTEEVEQTLVTFPCPLSDLPAKHGRGRARFSVTDRQQRPVYLGPMLRALLQSGSFDYFDISVPPEDAEQDEVRWASEDTRESPAADAWIPEPLPFTATVRPGYAITDPERFLEVFTRREILVLTQLGTGLARLGPGEIRALGTHRNKEDTVYDIEKEFGDLHRRKVWERLGNRLGSGTGFACEARELCEYLREAWRKAVYNRKDYENGRALLAAELAGDSAIHGAFLRCNQSGSAIWDNDRVRALAAVATDAHSFAKYLESLALFRDKATERVAPRQRSTRRASHLFEEAIEGLGDGLGRKLPRNVSDVFVGTSPEMRKDVCAELQSILTILANRTRV